MSNPLSSYGKRRKRKGLVGGNLYSPFARIENPIQSMKITVVTVISELGRPVIRLP